MLLPAAGCGNPLPLVTACSVSRLAQAATLVPAFDSLAAAENGEHHPRCIAFQSPAMWFRLLLANHGVYHLYLPSHEAAVSAAADLRARSFYAL